MTTTIEHWHRYGWERLAVTADAFAAYLRAHEPGELDTPVPDMDWTVRDVVGHVASVFRRYTVNPERSADAAEVARQNAADLAQVDQPVGELLDDLVAQVGLMEAAIDLVAPDHEFPFHAGQPITLAGGWGNAIGELLAHGDDIARATGRPWSVEDADLEPLWRFTTSVLAGWLTPEGRGATERWELCLGFAGGPIRLRVEQGSVTVDDVPGPVDHVVEGPAAATTLAVPYKRRTTDDPGLARLGELLLPL